MFPPIARLTDEMAAKRLFAPILSDAAVERLAVAYLAAAGEVSRLEVFDDDDARRITLPLRAIAKCALTLDALAVVLAHNHPSGDPQPTRADLDGTRALALTLKPLGIRVRDHLIYGGGRWASMRRLGLL